jgi:hypothetical protein
VQIGERGTDFREEICLSDLSLILGRIHAEFGEVCNLGGHGLLLGLWQRNAANAA